MFHKYWNFKQNLLGELYYSKSESGEIFLILFYTRDGQFRISEILLLRNDLKQAFYCNQAIQAMIKDFFPINPLLFHPYYPAFPCIIFYLQ
ncbi:hypothetical protein RIR_jg15633.t1 [Rhizophagus irregularis DAOM 181602=DAOM 197198]|nr:hypothetical protein RIR_jg15633.t1 [Rhizophagus irregularis DAOM 181602=DAOM 197198]